LFRSIQPTKLILILTRVFTDTCILQSAEDIIGAVILLEIGSQVSERGLLDSEIVGNGLVGGTGVGYGFRFAA
jgi:hypothetical protein